MSNYVLALDQETTSNRSIVFNRKAQIVSQPQQEFPPLYPSPGYVEHDPEKIWQSQLKNARSALRKANFTAQQLAPIGIANQRETEVLWYRESGKPIDNVVVWQSRIAALQKMVQ